jgi:twitching motility protein PilT
MIELRKYIYNFYFMQDFLHKILEIASQKNYSDVHLSTGSYPLIRDHSWKIQFIEKGEIKRDIDTGENIPILLKEDIEDIIWVIGGATGLEKFKNNFELDISYKYWEKDRYRVNCYIDSNGYCVAMRRIPQKIPTLEELWLGEQIKQLCGKSKWLILMTGPTGTGKSTNIAAMVDYINKTYNKHIITIEDPIEFVFQNDKSIINQREVGTHTKSFDTAIRACLREDPDVIVIGEMRDPETIKSAITLAETGHLVLSTLHTNDTVQTIDRIVDVFPAEQQDQIRMQFAMSLLAVVSQRLVPRADADARIPAREILINNDAVRNLIITGKNHQLYSVLEVWQKDGMILMDKYLVALFRKNLISRETLLSFSRDKDNIELLLR